MCYPIVKEQDFPARRKELQTNPDYRAAGAFCQIQSIGIIVEKFTLGVENGSVIRGRPVSWRVPVDGPSSVQRARRSDGAPLLNCFQRHPARTAEYP